MAFTKQIKEFLYSLSATDKYSDFDSRKSFNRVNKPDVQTSLLGASNANDSSASLTKVLSVTENEGIHETRLAWRHIKKWLHSHLEDLNNSLLAPCTHADMHELEKDLECELPACVSEFFRLTDGQNVYNDNGACGLFYGLRLLPIDEVAVMTESWRKVHRSILALGRGPSRERGAGRLPSQAGPPGQQGDYHHGQVDPGHPGHQQGQMHPAGGGDFDLSVAAGFEHRPRHPAKARFPEQNCVPPHTILPIYAHCMWIPIVTDGAGNYIAIDLSPGTPEARDLRQAKAGQVILFGRDFDTKFRIADTFGDFLLGFANDLEKGNWELRSSSDTEDMISGVDTELVYVDHATRKEEPYLDVLKDRAIEAWVRSMDAATAEAAETKALLAQLAERHSYRVPSWANNTDSVITDHLNKIDIGAEPSPNSGASKPSPNNGATSRP